jgi:dihydroorotate dehydrogenase (fumarate)
MSADLRTRYLGLELHSPLVASPSPLTGEVDSALALAEAGAAALVLPSLFEEEVVGEQLALDRSLAQSTEVAAEWEAAFPDYQAFAFAGDHYVAHLERLKAVSPVPVIASLNATTVGGWVSYAKRIQDAGADALELNLYHLAADPRTTGAEIEARDLALVAAVREAVSIPLAVKLSPFYSAMANFAGRVAAAGADGLVLFNRFYQPDLDLDTLDVVTRLDLSQSSELRLPLRWIAILRPQLAARVSLALTSGVHTGQDAVKALMVGADVAMTTSAVLRGGPSRLREIADGMVAWLDEHEYESVEQLRGSASAASVEDPSAFERVNYMKTLRSWSSPPELAPTAS